MSHFPLPNGYCRKVCRPARATPRQMSPKDVGRLARATAQNGYDPCFILAEVKKQLGCDEQDCSALIDAVDAGLQALEEDAQKVLQAILDVLTSLGLPKGEPPPEKGEPPTPWWRRLLRQLNIARKLYELVDAIVELWEAVNDLNETIARLIADVRGLMQCCKGK